jgi:hypothetical protein
VKGPRERVAFWAVIVALLGSHAARVAAGHDGEPWLGWVPPDVGWHLLWISAGAACVFWMTGRLWPDPP